MLLAMEQDYARLDGGEIMANINNCYEFMCFAFLGFELKGIYICTVADMEYAKRISEHGNH